jgi:hypothetical protein
MLVLRPPACCKSPRQVRILGKRLHSRHMLMELPKRRTPASSVFSPTVGKRILAGTVLGARARVGLVCVRVGGE